MFEKLKETLVSLLSDTNQISEERRALLDELAMYISAKLTSQAEVSLVFICTHNSRRSHMAQIWAQAAAYYFGHKGIKTYSGGTQKTSFNYSAIEALKKAGFKIRVVKDGKNPKYRIRFAKRLII